MSRIAIVANETNPAICSSMMMHVDMMADCGHDIVMFLQNKIDRNLFRDYNYKIENFERPSDSRICSLNMKLKKCGAAQM